MLPSQRLGRRAMLGAGLALPALGLGAARAQAAPLRIGVLCDMSGIYADNTGPGLVAATNIGVKEFGATVAGRPKNASRRFHSMP